MDSASLKTIFLLQQSVPHTCPECGSVRKMTVFQGETAGGGMAYGLICVSCCSKSPLSTESPEDALVRWGGVPGSRRREVSA